MNDIYKNIEEQNSNKKRKIIVQFNSFSLEIEIYTNNNNNIKHKDKY